MGREEGGGFRMGNTGIPVADSFRYLAKLIQYCKVKKKIKLKKNKIYYKKKTKIKDMPFQWIWNKQCKGVYSL